MKLANVEAHRLPHTVVDPVLVFPGLIKDGNGEVANVLLEFDI
jgi:hypothetical protein